jgi:hypothetical protein
MCCPGEAVHGDLEDTQGAIELTGLAPAEPGVGTGVEPHGEGLFFLEREGIELRAKDLAIDADQGCREGRRHRARGRRS